MWKTGVPVGVKFNDADLVGFPVRVVAGKKNGRQGLVELSLRRDAVTTTPIADAAARVCELLEQA
ncbi:MAG TPA: His/Gly/Thr/Pro-type tRNA ligase C-terminal domain-containing protein [Thermoanaerobaculaceae bacterium]|nr:His/Gly/Thr/Pro-type tRNA ligase C-terminal domain-containing protein [Thermoanaerobaculaceae bacterium]HRS16991.1 His/Gly/Thr/Pro-type tRNA ligase C-terminal domain-containing protein [Thermoanaerobaculaceae bacterium]